MKISSAKVGNKEIHSLQVGTIEGLTILFYQKLTTFVTTVKEEHKNHFNSESIKLQVFVKQQKIPAL